MARAALLDTKTQTLLELIGNGKRYRVPAYQRDYSWGMEQWEDLWNDILDLLDAPDERHDMGALVVSAINDREFTIIDGQQRLATLSIHVAKAAPEACTPAALASRQSGLAKRAVHVWRSDFA